MADVGDEVATDRVEPAQRGVVLGQHQDEVVEGRQPDLEAEQLGAAVAAGHLDLELAHLAVPAHLPRQQRPACRRAAASPDQAVRQG